MSTHGKCTQRTFEPDSSLAEEAKTTAIKNVWLLWYTVCAECLLNTNHFLYDMMINILYEFARVIIRYRIV